MFGGTIYVYLFIGLMNGILKIFVSWTWLTGRSCPGNMAKELAQDTTPGCYYKGNASMGCPDVSDHAPSIIPKAQPQYREVREVRGGATIAEGDAKLFIKEYDRS